MSQPIAASAQAGAGAALFQRFCDPPAGPLNFSVNHMYMIRPIDHARAGENVMMHPGAPGFSKLFARASNFQDS